MAKNGPYVGINNDRYGGMTDIGKIIRDAWAFGIIPETETCEGWLTPGIEKLWDEVNQHWEKYGFIVSNMPEELRQRYLRIQEEAIERARKSGWDPGLVDD